jgi:hypothetical protein
MSGVLRDIIDSRVGSSEVGEPHVPDVWFENRGCPARSLQRRQRRCGWYDGRFCGFGLDAFDLVAPTSAAHLTRGIH